MKIYIDGHCDTLTCAYDEKNNINDEKYCFNMKSANYISKNKEIPVIQFMATFVNPKFSDGFTRAVNIIDWYKKNKGNEFIIKSKEDLERIKKERKVGVLLTIENGKAIEDKLDNIDILYQKGVRIMSVNWNEDNLLGTGALTNKKTGLTEFGKEYIKKLEEKNIIIDISHSSERTFWDVIHNTTKPVIATHSCCYDICNHPRNLKDNQIKEIAKRKGIIGICFCSTFLKENGKADVTDIVKHIKYIIKLVGDDYIGLGTDFDGVDEEDRLLDIKNLKQVRILEENLKRENFNRKIIDKIMGENWYNFINENID